MERAQNCHPCKYDFQCYITGHHAYKDTWTPVFQEELICEKEPTNPYNRHAIKVIKGDIIVGHIPKLFSKIFSFVLLSFFFLFVLDVPHLTNEHRTQYCIAS